MDWQAFSVMRQIIYILGFAGHNKGCTFVATALLCCVSTKTQTIYKQLRVTFTKKLYLSERVIGTDLAHRPQFADFSIFLGMGLRAPQGQGLCFVFISLYSQCLVFVE